MNFMNKFLLVITIAGMFLVGMSSCEKSELRATEYDLPKSQAFVRFAFLSPGLPAVMIKVNNNKINGVITNSNGDVTKYILIIKRKAGDSLKEETQEDSKYWYVNLNSLFSLSCFQ